MTVDFSLLEKQVSQCVKCGLSETRINPVLGEGNLKTKILFIGEAPGATEDQQGRPFCGKAGKVLDFLLEQAGLKRNDIYIANILKCRPPKNRNPSKEEINSCKVYLDKQIELIQPKIICCLGNFSVSYIMNKFGLGNKVQGISKIHGKIYITPKSFGSIKIVPLYHPAVVTYNMNMKDVLAKDFSIIKNIPR